ncbi:MAG: Cu+-exporting ATPase, partial [Cellvibrionaceae bacterium]
MEASEVLEEQSLPIGSREQECFHCGEPCEQDEAIQFDAHNFCCIGCSSVYQILQEADLCGVYDLDEKASKVRTSDRRKYLLLDEPEIAQNFLEFDSQGVARVTFFSPNIHCSSCIWLLEHLGRLHTGILQSKVQFVKKEVTITYEAEQISLREVAHLMDKIGYGPLVEPRKQKKAESRGLVIRLAVAGFCFGNSMLISLPDYLSLSYQIPVAYQTIFAYINLLFGLPVFFYSASVYFVSAWKGLKHRFINIDVPISMGIIALFARSLIDILYFHEMGFIDSLAGLVFFLLIGRWYQHKTYQALSFDRDISSYFPIAVSKWVEGEEVTTKIQDLKQGDEVVIHNQELVPADAELVEGSASIDYSFVTGEALPTAVKLGAKLFAGGRQLGGPIRVRLNRKVINAHLTKLWNLEKDRDTADLNNLADLISRYFTAAIIILALLGASIWYFIDPSKTVDVFTAILIVACPCALALSVPFTYGHTLRVFGQQGFYLKHSDVIEKLASIDTIVFDKTGTLTRPLPEDVSYHGAPLETNAKDMLLAASSNSIHPLSKIIKKYLRANHSLKSRGYKWQEFDEIAGKGIRARAEGNLIRIGSASWLGADSDDLDHLTSVHIEINGKYFGYFKFGNAYRSGVLSMLEITRNLYRLELLSGDKASEAERLAPYFDQMLFKQTPSDKLRLIEQKREAGESVLMIGDG